MPLDLLFTKKYLTRMGIMYKKNTMNSLTRRSTNALHTKHSLISTGLMEESHRLPLPPPSLGRFLDFSVCFLLFLLFPNHSAPPLPPTLSNLYSNLNSSLVSGIIPGIEFVAHLILYILFLFFAHITHTHTPFPFLFFLI